jgi:hypothetical protein
MPRCNHCNTRLEIDESYDTQFEGNQYRDKIYGFCPNCNAEYQWEEIYVYQSFEHLEEV